MQFWKSLHLTPRKTNAHWYFRSRRISTFIWKLLLKALIIFTFVFHKTKPLPRSNMPVLSQAALPLVMADSAINGTSADNDDSPFSELIPAVVQCFVIMLGGYVAGRTKIISPIEAKGLNMFVSYAALPSLIFLSLATLDLSNINWMFLIAVFISKSVIFLFVAGVTSIVNWPQNFGKAGLYAIFCTQSNDFALGFPIIAALYNKTHPEYATYLYLVAPISLCILNPIGFVLLEIDKERSSMFNSTTNLIAQESTSKQVTSGSGRSLLVRVIIGVVRNPIVIMTFLGVLYNLIFGTKLPDFLYGILKVTGSAFSATALFLLGLNMVGKVQTMKNGDNLLVPFLLIVLKIVALPLIIKEVISLLSITAIFSNTGGVENITELGFLYGTFPTAPTVFVFASAYGVAIDVVASAMVACTFFSAPLMFISAKMISLNISDPASYYTELDTTIFYLSIASLVCSLWVLLIMFLSKKYRRVPHVFTSMLIISSFIGSIGTWIGRFSDPHLTNSIAFHASFVLIGVGIYTTKIFATIIAISTALLRLKKLCLVLKMKKYAWIACFGLVSTIFILYTAIEPLKHKPMRVHEKLDFILPKPLAIVVLVMDIICLIITLSATTVDQFYSYKTALYQQLLIEDKEDLMPEKERKEIIKNSLKGKDALSSVKVDEPKKSPSSYRNRRDEILCENFGICKRRTYKDQLLVTGYEFKKRKSIDIESLGFQFSLRGLGLPVGMDVNSKPIISDDEEVDSENKVQQDRRKKLECSKHANGKAKGKAKCQKMLEKYEAIVVSADESHSKDDLSIMNDDEHEYSPHLVLVIYICLTMLCDISTASCILLLEKPNGIYIELEFLNAIMAYSIGIVVFFLFGVDSKLILVPLQNLWRKFFNKKDSLTLPALSELDDETIHICEQFCTYHIDKCIDDLVKDRRWRLRLYKSVFWGKELVTWLIDVGLATNRADGSKYGKALLNGRIIKQFEEEHHFHDSFYFYVFNASSATGGFDGPSIQTISRSMSEDELSSS